MDCKVINVHSVRKLLHYVVIKKVYVYEILDIIERFDWLLDILNKNVEWVETEKWVKFIEYVSETLNETIEEIGYHATLMKETDTTQVALFRVLPLSILAKIMKDHVQDSVCKNLLASFKLYSEEKKILILSYKQVNKQCSSDLICRYNLGAGKAILESKGYFGITAKETQCYKDSESNECLMEYIWQGRNEKPFYKAVTSFLNVFLRKQKYVQDYVWTTLKFGKKPENSEELHKFYTQINEEH